MSKYKYRLCLGTLCLIAAFFAGYLWRESKKTIILEFGMFAGSNWDVANANSYVIIDKAIERFEAEHENVEIHYYSGIMKDDYSEWYARQLLSGDTPDVFMILTSDFNQLASLGALKNLEDLIASDPDFSDEAYFTTAFNTGKYHSIQYALPYETVPTLMFVNKTLLNKEGIEVPGNDWTWTDLYEICEAVTRDLDGDGNPDQFGTYNYSWLEAVYSNGSSLFDTDGTKAYFTDSGVMEAINFTKKIYDLNQGVKVGQEDFDNGNVAFMPLLFSDYRTYKTYPYKIKKYTNFQWDCITLPAGEDGGNISEVNSLLMGISSNTRHEELAWEFLKLLTYDEEIQMDIFRYSQGASVLKSVTSSEQAAEIIMEDMEEAEQVIDGDVLSSVIENGMITPKFQEYEDVMSLAESEVSKITEQDKNVDSSLKILQRTISRYLKQ